MRVANESPLINTAVLEDQYVRNDRLTARQSLWALRAGPALHTTVLDHSAMTGTETIVDIGCGNGTYLAELRRRRHTGPIVGLDLSAAMARQSRSHAATAIADAQALPLRDDSVDIALSLHMLYHVPDLSRAVSELRRVLRPGGTAMVTTNGPGHTIQAKQLLATAAHRVAGVQVDLDWDTRRFNPAAAANLLRIFFDDVDMYELGDTLPVGDPTIITNYIASWPPESIGLRAGPLWDQVLAVTGDLVAAHFATHQCFLVTSRVAVLRCR
jgi:SAM-dependent methyltransferase